MPFSQVFQVAEMVELSFLVCHFLQVKGDSCAEVQSDGCLETVERKYGFMVS